MKLFSNFTSDHLLIKFPQQGILWSPFENKASVATKKSRSSQKKKIACGSSWKAKKVDKTLGDVEAEALANTLVDRLAGVKAKKVKETLLDVKAVALVDTLADKVAEFGAKKHGEKLGYVEFKAPSKR